MNDPRQLTIAFAQKHQPWTQPYSHGVMAAHMSVVPHILASHTVLHAAKSVGKLATVFEALDHTTLDISFGQLDAVKAMSADLVTAALRLANLYKFDLATELVARVREKNGDGYPAWEPVAVASGGAPKRTSDGMPDLTGVNWKGDRQT